MIIQYRKINIYKEIFLIMQVKIYENITLFFIFNLSIVMLNVN